MAPLRECLIHWKKKLEQCDDDEKKIETIRKLYKVPITVELLRETKIGKIIKHLGKQPGKVGNHASLVLQRWRSIVASSQEDEVKSNKYFENKPKRFIDGDLNGTYHSTHKTKVHSKTNGYAKIAALSEDDANRTIKQEIDSSEEFEDDKEKKYSGEVNGSYHSTYEPKHYSKGDSYAETPVLSQDNMKRTVKHEIVGASEDEECEGYDYVGSNHNESAPDVLNEDDQHHLINPGEYIHYNVEHDISFEYDPEHPQISSKKIQLGVEDDKAYKLESSNSSHSDTKRKVDMNHHLRSDLEAKKNHKNNSIKKSDYPIHFPRSSNSSKIHGTSIKEKHSTREHSKEHNVHKKRAHDSIEYNSRELEERIIQSHRIHGEYPNGVMEQEIDSGYDPEHPQISPKKIRLDVGDERAYKLESYNSSHSNPKVKVASSHHLASDLEAKKSHKSTSIKKSSSPIHFSKSEHSSKIHGSPMKEKHSTHEHSKEHSSHKKRYDSTEHKSGEASHNGHGSSGNAHLKSHPSKPILENGHAKHQESKVMKPPKSDHHHKKYSPEKQSSNSSSKKPLSSTLTLDKVEPSNHSCEKDSLARIKSSVKNKSPMKVKVPQAEELTASEASFEACLGLNDVVTSKKKKSLSSKPGKSSPPCEVPAKKKHKEKKETKSSSKGETVKLSKTGNGHVSKSSSSGRKIEESCKSSSSGHKSSKPQLHNKDIQTKKLPDVPKPPPMEQADILSTLPEIQPNYKPLPRIDFDNLQHTRKKAMTNEEAIIFTSSKKDRTAVYSGRRNFYSSEVPSLFEMCTRILIENVEYIGYTGGVPYDLLKPVLERCTAPQLYKLEDFNSYLLEDTHDLWERHCQKEFRTSKREESETWREMYLRCFEEKEKKLKALTANISASMTKSNPVRQVKLAYVDSVVKPPREVARKQARNGTALPVNHTVKAGPPSKVTPRPSAPAINAAVASAAPIKSAGPISLKKPKMAPLMAKTLKCMKRVYRSDENVRVQRYEKYRRGIYSCLRRE